MVRAQSGGKEIAHPASAVIADEKKTVGEAVDAVKRLQLQWKNIGAVQRDQEQQLWDEFRAQCDVIFQKRQQSTQSSAPVSRPTGGWPSRSARRPSG